MKIRTADLTDALLDYHTARAQGVPAERLEIRRVPRTDTLICVERVIMAHRAVVEMPVPRPYSTDWHLAGALMDERDVFVEPSNFPRHGAVFAYCGWREPQVGEGAYGPNRMVAICRAVVRAAFGEEVEEVAVCG